MTHKIWLAPLLSEIESNRLRIKNRHYQDITRMYKSAAENETNLFLDCKFWTISDPFLYPESVSF